MMIGSLRLNKINGTILHSLKILLAVAFKLILIQLLFKILTIQGIWQDLFLAHKDHQAKEIFC
jgi:hypothetical protein